MLRKSKKYFACLATLSLTLSAAAQPYVYAGEQGSDSLSQVRQQIQKNSISEKELNQLQQVLRADPKNAEAHALLGRCYDIAGMRDMAAAQYQIANDMDPQRCIGVLEKFKAQYHDGDPADCFIDWVQIRKRFPGVQQVRDYEEAIARIYGTVSAAEEASLEEHSHGHNLRSVDSVLSVMASRRGDFERALQLSTMELGKHISDDGLLAKSMALNGLKRYGAASVVAQGGYVRNFIYPGAAQELAKAYFGLGNYKKALAPALVNICIWTEPQQMDEANKLAQSVLEKSKSSLAEALNSEEIKFMENSEKGPKFAKQMAQILLNLHMEAEAAAFLAERATNNKLDAEGFALYATVLANQGKYKEAMAMYQTASLLAPEKSEYTKAAERTLFRALNKPNDLALRIKNAMHAK